MGHAGFSISLYVNLGAVLLYKRPEAFQAKRLIWSISSMRLDLLLAIISIHVHGHSHLLPLVALQLWVGLGSLEDQAVSLEEDCWLGILSGVTMLIVNDAYCHDCLAGCAFL